MISVIQRPIVKKRVPVFVDRTDDILAYDVDNLYPQRNEEISARSGITMSCIERLARFTRGRGFANSGFGNTIINRKRQTVNKILQLNALDFAQHNGFALHFNYNLEGRISETNFIYFKYCRLGLPDENHFIHDIKFSTNWEQDPFKEEQSVRTILEYDIFNPNPEVVLSQMERDGGIANYKGQIMFYTPEMFVYPKSTFDAVVDSVQTSAEVPEYELGNVQNSFNADGIFRYKGRFEGEREKQEFKHEINQFKGPKNAGSIIVVEDESETDSRLFEKIDRNNNDRMYDSTDKKSRDRIIERYAIPKALVGIYPDSGMFNQENMRDAFAIYNEDTEERRADISEAYKLWTNAFRDPINPEFNFSILPQQFGTDVTSTDDND